MRHYTNQEAFDLIVDALRKQGRKSGYVRDPEECAPGENDFRCMYRAPDGCKCAAGHILPDNDYNSNMEGHTFLYIYENFELSFTLGNADIVSDLQGIHDFRSVDDWEKGFAEVADLHDLRYVAP